MKQIGLTGRLASVIIIALFSVIGCDNYLSPDDSENDNVLMKPYADQIVDLEKVLADFAKILPEALLNPELSYIVWNEAKSNLADEPYSLWSKVADVTPPSGKTLRQGLDAINSSDVLTDKLDLIEGLQVYIHTFEEWDSTQTLPTTFTPLTIDDIDVTKLKLYDEYGVATALPCDSTSAIPDYPIAIVGIHESFNYEGDIPKGLGKAATTNPLKITKIKLKKSAWWYEPWWKGKAEVYFRVFDTSLLDDSWGGADWEWKLGSYAPSGSYKHYRCWKWNRR